MGGAAKEANYLRLYLVSGLPSQEGGWEMDGSGTRSWEEGIH